MDDQQRKDSNGSPASQQAAGGQQVLTPPNDPLIGRELAGRYEITSVLGAGAMGVVYKARHKVLNREVAVKVLKREACGDETTQKRFATEAFAASTLTHANLIAVHDYGFIDEYTPFLIMDYLEGESLSDVLKREGRLAAERVIAISRQMCAGLSHAHHKGLVHRDLKPTNIILVKEADGEETVKIVDFGIVKPVAAEEDLTQTGQIFGTPFYMSPEQCQGQKLDGRSDIYALGCLMFRMLSGRPPFVGDNALSTVVMHVKDAAPPLPATALGSHLARELAPIVARCLAKSAAERFQSADELRHALEQVAQGQSASQRLYAPPQLSAANTQSMQTTQVLKAVSLRTWIASALVVVTALAAVAYIFMTQMQALDMKERAAQQQQDRRQEAQQQEERAIESEAAADNKTDAAQAGMDAETVAVNHAPATTHHLPARHAQHHLHPAVHHKSAWQKFKDFFRD